MAGHHFNYEIQAWVLRGRVKACAHPDSMRAFGGIHPCCNAFAYQGMTEAAAVAAHRKSHPARPRLDFVNHRGE